MNILFIAYNVNIHSRTGDAVHVRELVSSLAALGNKISLIAGFDENTKNYTNFFENNSNISLHYFKDPKMKFPRFRDISLLSSCLNMAKKNYPDIIYERNFSCRIGAILSKILAIPLILEINGVLDEEMEMLGRSTDIQKRVMGNKLKKLFYSQANKIVVVSPRIKESLIEKYNIKEDKIIIVANGANIELFKPIDQKIAQSKLDLSQEYKYICFVGNLTSWQGVEYLINATPSILKKNSSLKFLIVGDGVMREELENMVRNKNLSNYFLFIGSVPFEKVPLYINASDVCAATFTNNRKCSPLKVFEYLACGKPVVLGNIGNDAKIFTENKSVFVINLDNPAEFADRLYEIIFKDSHKENGIDAREFILKNYTWEHTARKILDICAHEIG